MGTNSSRAHHTSSAGMWCDALPLLIHTEWQKVRNGLRTMGNNSTTAAISAWTQVRCLLGPPLAWHAALHCHSCSKDIDYGRKQLLRHNTLLNWSHIFCMLLHTGCTGSPGSRQRQRDAQQRRVCVTSLQRAEDQHFGRLSSAAVAGRPALHHADAAAAGAPAAEQMRDMTMSDRRDSSKQAYVCTAEQSPSCNAAVELWPRACCVVQQALASAHGEIPATPGIQHIEEVAQRTTEIKEGMEVELTSRVSCAGQHNPAVPVPMRTAEVHVACCRQRLPSSCFWPSQSRSCRSADVQHWRAVWASLMLVQCPCSGICAGRGAQCVLRDGGAPRGRTRLRCAHPCSGGASCACGAAGRPGHPSRFR